uniref:Venom protein 214 n=1 Tax=Lychas mucronatus TaxID=172552 RepID=VP214_LYCMC|nr:RecName: Full=Venom protein 214; Flags: Precursor [Lychas mucronatus]
MIRYVLVIITCFLVAAKSHVTIGPVPNNLGFPDRSILLALVAPTCEPELEGLVDECVNNVTIRNVCYDCFREGLTKVYSYCCHKYNHMYEWCLEYFSGEMK